LIQFLKPASREQSATGLPDRQLGRKTPGNEKMFVGWKALKKYKAQTVKVKS
jgi:hypothetical protein